ncbi:MAG TPA: DUF2249 domain-containing protein [Rhodanobacter sp.]|nr:DUF2249 domain-containing protein [Rhodanobacter sp.]
MDLDVRPILRDGGEPFEQIMATVAGLRPDQGLRLFATFKPTPLLHMLGSRGYAHDVRELAPDDWEVLFTPAGRAPASAEAEASAPGDDDVWPPPALSIDNRDLDPPEPMVRTLAALESLKEGEVLSALLCREPMFLLPELVKRGHRWRGGFDADGTTYRLAVRIGSEAGSGA